MSVPFKGKAACIVDTKYTKGFHTFDRAVSDSENTNDPPKVVAFYTCPKCERVEPSSNNSFQLTDLDKKVKCKSCKHKSVAKRWTCQCKRKWHLCDTHSKALGGVDHAAPRALCKNQHPHINKCCKRKNPPKQAQSFESMCQEDAEHQARKVRMLQGMADSDTIVLGVPLKQELKPGMLSPKLRLRFCSRVCIA